MFPENEIFEIVWKGSDDHIAVKFTDSQVSRPNELEYRTIPRQVILTHELFLDDVNKFELFFENETTPNLDSISNPTAFIWITGGGTLRMFLGHENMVNGIHVGRIASTRFGFLREVWKSKLILEVRDPF